MQHGVHLSAVRGEIRMNKENILEIDNLERSYSTVMPDGETKVYSVLRGISFQVKRGEFIGIMGSSGCGKTTLLKTIGMLNKPNGGRVFYNGEDTTEIYGDHLAEIRRTQLAFVFQDFYLMNTINDLLYEKVIYMENNQAVIKELNKFLSNTFHYLYF